MLSSTTLLFLCALPAAGALPISILPTGDSKLPRIGTMLVMLAVLALSTGVFLAFDGSPDARLAEIDVPWIASAGVHFHLAVDSLNVYLLLLTAILFPVVLGCCWKTARTESSLFLTLILLLEAGLLGTFLSQNLMLFFVFWEAVLIPMVILLLVFGGRRSGRAARTFFLYTLAGSVLLLAAIILLGVEALQQTGAWSFEFDTLYALQLDWHTQLFVFSAVFLACAIKCPLFPFHSWLPPAYVEAPAAGTALMAGALSKMGAFGLIKLALPLCPQVVTALAPYLMLLAVISILYGAVLALRQEHFKQLVAYSSLSHMGYIVLGIFCLQDSALHGALLQMLSHGMAVAGLFLLLGLMEQRLGEPYLQLTALSTVAPRMAVMLMLLVLTSVALPLTSGFTAEFLVLLGAFQQGMAALRAGGGQSLTLVAAVLASAGMVLGAGYMLRFARVLLFGVPAEKGHLQDLNLLEVLTFFPLLLVIFWIGVWPAPVMSKAQSAVTELIAPAAVQSAAESAYGDSHDH